MVSPVQGPGSGFWPDRPGQIFFFWKNQNNVVLVKKKKQKKVNGFEVGSCRVPGRPAGSTGSGRVNSQPGFGLHPNRSHARVGRVPGWPAGLGGVLKLWFWIKKMGWKTGPIARALIKWTSELAWLIKASPAFCFFFNIFKKLMIFLWFFSNCFNLYLNQYLFSLLFYLEILF